MDVTEYFIQAIFQATTRVELAVLGITRKLDV